MKYIILFIFSMAIVACTSSTNKTAKMSENEKKLQWIKTADARQDAQNAISINDYRFMALTKRGIFIPGIDPEQSNQYEKKCGIHLIDGVTDAVTSEGHLQMMQKANAYALQYNTIIKKHCSPM